MKRDTGLSLPPEAMLPESAPVERVRGGSLNLFMLLWRVPLRARLITLAISLAAPVPMFMAFLLGWGKFDSVRSFNKFAAIIAITLLLIVHFLMELWALRRVYTHVEDAIADLRSSILRLVSTSEVPVLDSLGAGTLDSVVNGDARLVTGMMPTIMLASEFVSGLTVGLVFAAMQSPLVLVLFVVTAVAAYQFRNRIGDVLPILHEAEGPESRFRSIVSDILAGPRELLIDRSKGDALAGAAGKEDRDVGEIRTAASGVFGVSLTLVQLFTAIVVISCRELAGVYKGEITIGVVILIAVIQGYFGYLMMNQEQLRGAAAAARRIRALEAGLKAAPRVKHSAASFVGFHTLHLRNIVQRAVRQKGDEFVFGPADVTIARGTVTLVRGSNGSGKTTFLEILMGIRKPASGSIEIDGHKVELADVEAYRSLFSPVFAKLHLYDRPYGLEGHDKELAQEWLTRLELPADVPLHASAKVSAALSTGQRKRLALVRAILEMRPILILDEYAADQDVRAREAFYNDILPRLKEQGRTIVAVVHEETRPACADQFLRVIKGKIIPDLG
jgi:putative ATP-binding cassette transporter